MYPFFTIGHSTHPIDEFVELLRSAGITLVADVRTAPRSRTNVQYNHDVLPQSLATFQIAYEHIEALGGLRGRQQDVSPNINAFWQNESFHNYADYAMGENFRGGLVRLRSLGRMQLRHHVRRSSMVAMPSTDYRRLSAGDRRYRISHSRPRAHRTRAFE